MKLLTTFFTLSLIAESQYWCRREHPSLPRYISQLTISWMLFLFSCVSFIYSALFLGEGHGAKGENEYEFSLEFLKPVKPEVTAIRNCNKNL